MSKKINIQYLPIDQINPYNNNPRQNEDAITPVMESIKDYGMTIPIIVDKDNVIISGHTRFLACKNLLEINPEAL